MSTDGLLWRKDEDEKYWVDAICDIVIDCEQILPLSVLDKADLQKGGLFL